MTRPRLSVATELAPCCKKTLPGQCFVGHEKFDLLWHGKKIAGAAQRRSKLGLLIQGSVQPPQPDLLRGDWERGMRSAAPAFLSGFEKQLEPDAELLHHTARLAAEKFSQPAHNNRR
jgi:hypothetical protein